MQQLREALKILAERVLILEHMIGIHGEEKNRNRGNNTIHIITFLNRKKKHLTFWEICFFAVTELEVKVNTTLTSISSMHRLETVGNSCIQSFSADCLSCLYTDNSEGSGFGSILDPLSFSAIKTNRLPPVKSTPQAPALGERLRRSPL